MLTGFILGRKNQIQYLAAGYPAYQVSKSGYLCPILYLKVFEIPCQIFLFNIWICSLNLSVYVTEIKDSVNDI